MSEIFAKYLKTDEIVFKYAKGMRDIYGKEIHTYHEVFFLLHGDVEFLSDEGRYRLEPYTTVVIPKGAFHQFNLYGMESDYHRLVLNFEHVSGLDELFPAAFSRVLILQNEAIHGIFSELRCLADHPLTQPENDALLKAYLAQMVVRIRHADPISRKEYRSLKPLTRNTITYINQSIKKELTVQRIADNLHVSASYLAHSFQKDMNISLHRYLLEKRLMRANQMIGSGTPPTQAAIECGFREYSGFYRQYKKMFDVSPRDTNARRIQNEEDPPDVR